MNAYSIMASRSPRLTGDMSEELDDLMTRAAAAEGVLKFEIMAG